MADYERFAIYWTPEIASPLARWGAHWLGWCADAGEPREHPGIDGLPRPVAELTAMPRRYGLHATLKAPFRLAPGKSIWCLESAIEEFAATTAPFRMPRLEVTTIGGFVAICPSVRSAALARLAADCVCFFEPFRAPMTPAERRRRGAAGLTPGQAANLATWGYPYVMNEFRFHVTLTGRLEPDEAAATAAVLGRELDPILASPVTAREIALFGDPGDGMPFRLIERYSLTAERTARKAATLSAIGPSLLTEATSDPRGAL